MSELCWGRLQRSFESRQTLASTGKRRPHFVNWAGNYVSKMYRVLIADAVMLQK